MSSILKRHRVSNLTDIKDTGIKETEMNFVPGVDRADK
jgi:hypothetical protein